MHTLTQTQIKDIQPGERTQRLYDGGGLYLEVSPTGGRWWRFKYQHSGKEKRVSLGVYPATTLKLVREKAAAVRSQLAAGIDPSAARQAVKQSRVAEVENTFEAVAREWHSCQLAPRVSAVHAETVLSRLERDIFPFLGSTQIGELDAATVLKVLRRVEGRGSIETAHRELFSLGQICRYAVATSRATRDVCADLKGALRPYANKHMAAITDPEKVGQLMRGIDGYQGSFLVRCALQLQALLFVRPGELRHAEWCEFDLDGAMWTIPAGRMKAGLVAKETGPDHLVPLASQAVAILRELHQFSGHNKLVFPSTRGGGRPISENTVLMALRALGYAKNEMSGHGFRATARTLLDEVLGVEVHIIEQQLAHKVKDSLGRAYNRTTHMKFRVGMMQQWADYLDSLRAGGHANTRT